LYLHSSPTRRSSDLIRFDCTGWWARSRRTAAYTSLLIKYGLRDRPDLIFCGHLNFSPVARWLKRIARIPLSHRATGEKLRWPQRSEEHTSELQSPYD